MIIACFLTCGASPKKCLFWNFTPKDDAIEKNWCDLSQDNFPMDFKTLTGFALAIWERAKPAPYFEGLVKCIF